MFDAHDDSWIEQPLDENIFIATAFEAVPLENPRKIFQELGPLLGDKACIGQLFDADKIASWRHLYYATIQAINAHKNCTMIARSLDVEILLHVAAERQIHRALSKIGLTASSTRVACLLLIPAIQKDTATKIFASLKSLLKATMNSSLLDLTPEKCHGLMKAYRLPETLFPTHLDWSKKENQDAIVDAIINQGAILELDKNLQGR